MYNHIYNIFLYFKYCIILRYCWKMEKCLICLEPRGKLVHLTDKGKASINEFALLRQEERVKSNLDNGELRHVHEDCRKWYNNRKRISTANKIEENSSKSLKVTTRSSSDEFSWQSHCLICGKIVDPKHKHPLVYSVHTVDLKDRLLKDCVKRLSIKSDDQLALDVQSRLSNCLDLVAVNAKYHKNCRTELSTDKHLNPGSIVGDKSDDELKKHFKRLVIG